MIEYVAFNSNGIRKRFGFPNYKNPNLITNDILTMINDLYNTNYKSLDFNDPFLSNLKVQYANVNNIEGWGLFPLQWAYIDIMNYIINCFHPVNNFLTKLERISISKASRYKMYYHSPLHATQEEIDNGRDIAYEIVLDFESKCYEIHDEYSMSRNNSKIITMYNECEDGSLCCYILNIGFDPYECSKFFSCSTYLCDNKNCTYRRYNTLKNIMYRKIGNMPSYNPGYESNVVFTCGRNNISTDEQCEEFVHKFDFCNLNMERHIDKDDLLDDEVISIMDNIKPGVTFKFVDNENNVYFLNTFTHFPEKRTWYGYFKAEYNMIRLKQIRDFEKKNHVDHLS